MKLTRVEYHNYEAYYVNNNLVFENNFLHNNGLRKILAALEIEYEETYVSSDAPDGEIAESLEPVCNLFEHRKRQHG